MLVEISRGRIISFRLLKVGRRKTWYPVKMIVNKRGGDQDQMRHVLITGEEEEMFLISQGAGDLKSVR